MAITNLPPSFLRDFADLKREVAALRKRASLVSASISTGTLTVKKTGQIVLVGVDGTEMILAASGFPQITMAPSGDSGNPSTITAVDGGGEAAIVIESGANSTTLTRTQLDLTGQAATFAVIPADLFTEVGGGQVQVDYNGATLEHIDSLTGSDGGFIYAFAGGAQVGIQSGTPTQYFQFDAVVGTKYIGVWNTSVFDANAGLMVGQSAAGSAGDTSHVTVYGPTMASTMVPIATLADTVKANAVTASSTSSFTLGFGASGAGYRVNFWCFRI